MLANEEEPRRLHSVLTNVVRQSRETGTANNHAPRPGSAAAQEIAEHHAHPPNRGERLVEECYYLAGTRLFAAEDHLEALARLLEDQSFAYAPASLARTALETSARA